MAASPTVQPTRSPITAGKDVPPDRGARLDRAVCAGRGIPAGGGDGASASMYDNAAFTGVVVGMAWNIGIFIRLRDLAAEWGERISVLDSSDIASYPENMTVEAIKEAIAGLPDTDRQALAAWLNELDYDAWDRQMVRDFSGGGRGNALVEKMKREITEGRAVPLSEGAAKAGQREPRH